MRNLFFLCIIRPLNALSKGSLDLHLYSFHFPLIFLFLVGIHIKSSFHRSSTNYRQKNESSYLIWTLTIPVVNWLSNLFAIEISTVHVVDINLYTVLVQKQLCQHRAFTWDPYRRYWWNRTCFNEHPFFKTLTFVFTSSVTAVLNYNSPKCHNW